MIRRLALLACLAALAAAPARAATPTYYLALGDSLAAGTQPTALYSDASYPAQLLALLRRTEPTLRLENLGCPGETSNSLVDGGLCNYDSGTQLAQAVAFLKAHAGSVSLVTIDVGANDLLQGCDADDRLCVGRVVDAVATRLERILRELRTVAPSVRIVGVDYYDPLLAEWLTGTAGEATARASVAGVEALNTAERRAYARHGARVAGVATAFSTASFAPLVLYGQQRVPKNVAVVCRWTWACSQDNVHPTRTGYGVIARTILAALRR
jgi:lysophospholipase L1-like esterase